jgi:hypothetical protein
LERRKFATCLRPRETELRRKNSFDRIRNGVIDIGFLLRAKIFFGNEKNVEIVFPSKKRIFRNLPQKVLTHFRQLPKNDALASMGCFNLSSGWAAFAVALELRWDTA